MRNGFDTFKSIRVRWLPLDDHVGRPELFKHREATDAHLFSAAVLPRNKLFTQILGRLKHGRDFGGGEHILANEKSIPLIVRAFSIAEPTGFGH